MEMARVRQVFGRSLSINIKEHIRRALIEQGIIVDIPRGGRIGIAVGSRGIYQIDRIVRAVAEILMEQGAHPAVFASMGSHGGGTVAGQLEILKSLGISQDTLGIPVVASDKCRRVERFKGFPVYANSLALSFDGLVVVNRVKPHTSFHSEVESGLTKMVAVGIGGPKGAEVIHSGGASSVAQIVEEVGGVLTERLPILFGVALVEDKRHRTKTIRVCRKEDFLEADRQLLPEARENLPCLPFSDIDVLIVNELGKCFSGTGMDTNVIGRFGIRGLCDRGIDISYIVVLDLAEKSFGNANGIGLADITTKKLVDKIDYPSTLKNVLTTSFLGRAKIPVTLRNDKEAVETAIRLTKKSRDEIRVVNIPNTLELEEFHVSSSLVDTRGLEVVEDSLRMRFDDKGNFMGYV